MWNRLAFYGRFAWRSVVLRLDAPLIYGIAVTDRCNLRCRGCAIPALGRPDMTWERLTGLMRGALNRGFRELYFTGGEPMLWHDGERRLQDAVAEARRIGFHHVHVYTNGTLGLETAADLFWVSMDGLPGTFELRRDCEFNRIERAIRGARHDRIAIIYTVDRNTADGVEPFLRWVAETKLPVLGVMFYFHTPYYGRDELFLTAEERAPIIDRLLECARAGLPVVNSRAGLLALRTGRWRRRPPIAAVADVDGESVCCRAAEDVCVDCGYAAAAEICESLRLRPSALLGMARYW